MYIIGITGPTGAGKTTVAKLLEAVGALNLNCDEIYRELLVTNNEMKEKIETRFTGVLDTKTGEINRDKLRSYVWGNQAALGDLNLITHGYVKEIVEIKLEEFKNSGGKLAVIDAIALIESGFGDKCDIIVGILALSSERSKRVTVRDDISLDAAENRMNAQQNDEFYRKNCDYIIENTDNTDVLFRKEKERFLMKILIDEWFKKHTDKMLADLEKLIAIQSVRSAAEPGAPYGKNSRESLSAAQQMLEKNGIETKMFEDMIVTASYGANPEALGILAHLDIVEAGEGWDTDPFKLTEIDGKLYGRGVIDNKGPAVAAMYAVYCVRDLIGDLSKGVQLIFGSSEETGFDDIAEYLKKNKTPPNVFTPDAEFPVVNREKGRFTPFFGAKWEKDTTLPRIISITGGKTTNIVPNRAEAVVEGLTKDEVEAFCREYSKKTGIIFTIISSRDELCSSANDIKLTIKAEGTAAHSSRPKLGNNAQTGLIEMLAAMPFAKSKGFEHVKSLNKLFPHNDYHGSAFGLDYSDEITGNTTLNFSVLRYDELEFSGAFDSRTASVADKDDLLEKTGETLAAEAMTISYHELKKSHLTPEDTPFVQTLLKVYEDYTGKKGECICMGGLTYAHDIEGGVAFGAAMPGDDNRAHGANEYIELEHLLRCAKMFTQVIIDLCV